MQHIHHVLQEGDLVEAASRLHNILDTLESPTESNPPVAFMARDSAPLSTFKEKAKGARKRKRDPPGDVVIPELPSQVTRRTFSWDDRFVAFKEYKRANGSVNVPRTWSGDDPNHPSFNLGEWVGRQRQAKKKGKLEESRITLLRSVGFNWEAPRVRTTVKQKRRRVSFDERIEGLRGFKEKHGHMRIPVRFSGDGPGEDRLGAWASNVRQRARTGTKQHGLSGISSEKRDRLSSLGFIWNVETGARWEDRISMLNTFLVEHGHLRIPRDFSGDRCGEHSLGSWVHYQRVKCRQNKLEPERKQQLDELGFIWAVRRCRDCPVADVPPDSKRTSEVPKESKSDAAAPNNANVYLDDHAFGTASLKTYPGMSEAHLLLTTFPDHMGMPQK